MPRACTNSTEKVEVSKQPVVTEYTHLDHPVSKNECVEKFSNSAKFQNTPKKFYAGKRSSNFEHWKEITSDRKIL